MKLSNIKYMIWAAVAGACFCACSDIKVDDRYLSVDSVVPERAVLIEDFTGQNCVNCPAAHEVIELLVDQYGDKVIPVSIHCGGFGVSVDLTRYPNYIGLMEAEGTELNDRYHITEWPKGVIDGQGGAVNPDEWAARVREDLSKPSTVNIEVEAVYNPLNNKVDISSTFHPTADFDGRISIWVTESDIVAFQRDKDKGRIPDYVHNNVFRATLTGIEGERYKLKANIYATDERSFEVIDSDKQKWNPDNLAVVVFLSDEQGVVQAAKANVVTN